MPITALMFTESAAACRLQLSAIDWNVVPAAVLSACDPTDDSLRYGACVRHEDFAVLLSGDFVLPPSSC